MRHTTRLSASEQRRLGGLLLGLALLAGVCEALAQPRPTGRPIFTCVTAAGRTLTADRPIDQCLDREQRVLNSDGSLRMVLQPSLTSDERAAVEAEERRKLFEREAKRDAIRRDRNLVARYPDDPTHARARQAALEPVLRALKASEQRLSELQKERKPLIAETEFYQGKDLPAKLKDRLDAVDASIDAQRALALNQTVELQRVNALFDAERARLQQLWDGAQPGSLGPLPQSALAGDSAPHPVRR